MDRLGVALALLVAVLAWQRQKLVWFIIGLAWLGYSIFRIALTAGDWPSMIL